MSPVFTSPVKNPDSVCFVATHCPTCGRTLYGSPDITVFYCPVCEPAEYLEARPDADMSVFQSK